MERQKAGLDPAPQFTCRIKSILGGMTYEIINISKSIRIMSVNLTALATTTYADEVTATTETPTTAVETTVAPTTAAPETTVETTVAPTAVNEPAFDIGMGTQLTSSCYVVYFEISW